MSIARRIQNARSGNSFGSFGSIDPVVSTTDGINIPGLVLEKAEVGYIDSRKGTLLWEQGKWMAKQFPARQGEEAIFILTIGGAGKSLVFATFRDGDGKLQFLFVKRLGQGTHTIRAKVPFRVLPEFRFGVAKKLDARVGTAHLTNKEIHGITNNMLLITDTPDMYSTTESLQGLGAVQRFTDSYTGVGSNDVSYAAAASGNTLKTADGKFRLWDGRLSQHSWATHGYTGRKESGVERSGAKEGAVEGPFYVCDPSGYYAHRTSTYMMQYDKNGNQLGYDAMETIYDSKGIRVAPITALAAGVPICMVGQFFVHDPEGTAGLLDNNYLQERANKRACEQAGGTWVDGACQGANLSGGPQYAALGDTRWKGKGWTRRKAIHSHTLEKAAVATGRYAVDAYIDTAEAATVFIKDPSLRNAGAIVTGYAGLNSQWHYADRVKISRNNIFFVPTDIFHAGITPGSPDSLVTTQPEVSAIPYRLKPGSNIPQKGRLSPFEPIIDKKDYAPNVEWFNPTTKRWSKPQKKPPFDLTTDKDGKFQVFFRMPRQLDPKDDREQIAEAIANGAGNYSRDLPEIRYAYPYPKRTKIESKGYNLLGRVEGKDSDTEMRRTFGAKIGNEDFRGMMFLDYTLMIKPPNHPRALGKGGPHWMNTGESFHIRFADPKKYAYLDNPEIDYSTYVDGELKPGSIVLVIGKALGTIRGDNCIITNRGWKDGAPSAETIASYGTKVPPGDTPLYVHNSLIKPNSKEMRKVTDGSAAGTLRADFLEFINHITADDLTDDKLVSGEQALIDAWKEIFDLDLNADWFVQQASSPSTALTEQDPNNPLHYIVETTVNNKATKYSFPYSIAWFKIPQSWVGPYLDYDDDNKLQAVPGRPHAISDANTDLFIVQATYTGKILQTRYDIVAETTEQRELLKEGFPLAPSGNPMNYDPVDVTAQVAVDSVERDFLTRTGQTHANDKPGKKYRYTDSWVKSKFKFGNEDVVMKERPSIAGFSNSADFYVEDVTDKWGALSGAIKEEINPYDENVGLAGPSYILGGKDEYLAFGALGSHEAGHKDGFFSDAKKWKEAGEALGKMSGSATGHFISEAMDGMEDLSLAEKLGLGLGALGVVAISAGAAAYLIPAGIGKGVGSMARGVGKGIRGK